MIYNEHFEDSKAEKFLNDNQGKLKNIINIGKHVDNDDMVIVLGHPLNTVDTFQGLGKVFCILSEMTGKDTDTLINILKEAIRLEKEYDKKHKAEERIIKDAYKNN